MEQTKITKGEKSRQLLIEKAADLFLQNGYFHTGIAEILKNCNLTKGSFYFYFASKDDLGAAVATYYVDELCGWFEQILKKSYSYKEFVDELIGSILMQIEEGQYYGCPFTCFATETAVQIQAVREVCCEAVNRFEELFMKARLLDGVSEEEAKKQGARALAAYEGCMVCYRITQSRYVILNMKDVLYNIR